jgi:hypothetical protein
MILNQSEKTGGLPYASSSRDYFHSFMNIFGMVDLGFSGNPFTWSNHREWRSLIKQRLDRGLASTQWIHLFPTFSIIHLPAISSDHNPLLLDTITPYHQLPKPFCFEEFWTKHPDCMSTIQVAWDSSFLGTSGNVLSKKLKSIKAALKMWNSLYFGNIQKKKKKKKKKINTLLVDRAQQSTHLSHPIQEELVLQKALDDLYLQEEILWKSKSQETWLTCKDLNTKFFHLSTLIKRRWNAIDFLKLSFGDWTSD